MQVIETTYFEGRETEASLRERLFAAGVVLLTMAGLVYLRLFNPSAPGSLYPSCPFNSLTGLYCPGCGMTRGLHQLTHGHFLEALHFNALMLMLLPFAAYAFVSYALVAARGRGLPMPFTRPPYVKALFWIMMVFWILRNIPVYPLTLLAP
ncbi:MAG TPA: DUF2752 domain-containing protein [Pyrinomonadaceae bacterium]|nr:DUF2752 domain-containing protein [Pyrinomonadaceae bacterium]